MGRLYSQVTDEMAAEYDLQIRAKRKRFNDKGVRLEDFMEHEELMNAICYQISEYVFDGNGNALEMLVQLAWEVGREDGATTPKLDGSVWGGLKI